MLAFCLRPLPVFHPVFPGSRLPLCTTQRTVTIPHARASNTKSSRKKRPRPDRTPSGFGITPPSPPAASTPAHTIPDAPDDPVDANADARTAEMQKRDASGISLEHRLREEILHPLRKPKQTLFGTLAFSATLGFFFACARLAAEKDSPSRVLTNVAIDSAAICVFATLLWRELEFGRRSLNSIAGQPQPRDLPIIPLSSKTSTPFRLPFLSNSDHPSSTRLSSLLASADVVVVAGRATDVRKYLDRCIQLANYDSEDTPSDYSSSRPALVAFATDARDNSHILFTGATAVAPRKGDKSADWAAWLGDAVPPRRNVALFKIASYDPARDPANSYIVNIDDPVVIPLPPDAKRQTVFEV